MQKIKTFIVKKTKRLLMFMCNKICGTRHDKFFFIGIGNGYNDNSRAVSEKLHDVYPESKIYWLLDKKYSNNPNIPSYIHRVNNSVRQIFHMATSKAIVVGVIEPIWLYKTKQQKLVQVWHGDRAIKTILNDCIPAGEPKVYFKDGVFDYMTSGSAFYNRIISTAFGYHGKVIDKGSPRNDLLLKDDNSLKSKIKESLSLPEEKKILLYAPTFRDSSIETQKENFDVERTIDAMKRRFGGEWICLGRFHPSISAKMSFNSKRIIDVSSYYDMSDLLFISDALITDYSSSAGDFVLTDRPVYLYQPDADEYCSNDRTFYYDVDDLPFMRASSQSELEKLILNSDDEKIHENCRKVREFYGINETGNASECVVNALLDK